MSEQIDYIENAGAGTVHRLTVTDEYTFVSGDGLYVWPFEALVDEIPHTIAIHRTYKSNKRDVSLRFLIHSTTYSMCQQRLATFLGYFLADVDAKREGQLRIATDSGYVYTMNVAPGQAEVERVGIYGVFVTVPFVASNPLWALLPGGRITGSFNGATPVNVAFYNVGDVKAWPEYTLTGVVNAAKITYPDATYVNIATTTAAAADILKIYTKPGQLRVDYIANGTAAAVNWSGYAGTLSTFSQLPTGSGTLTLTATSGTPTFVCAWDIQKVGIS